MPTTSPAIPGRRTWIRGSALIVDLALVLASRSEQLAETDLGAGLTEDEI